MAKKRKKNHKHRLVIFILIIVLLSFPIALKDKKIPNLPIKNTSNFSNIENYNKDYDLRYENYYKENSDVSKEEIVSLVNAGIDKIKVSYDPIMKDLINQKYFILKRLKRYINYYHKSNLSLDKVVTMVNANRDYEYYTHVKDANLDKGNLVLVNKYYKLTDGYNPSDLVTLDSKYGNYSPLRKEAYDAYLKMYEAAESEGLHFYLNCAFRDYQLQTTLYNRYKNNDGIKSADTYSARPGQSEHQTGLAFDFDNFTNFEYTKEYAWLQENAYKYGFILRFPKDKEDITGYIYEPWHYRYVGVEHAKKIKKLGLTLEEYYAYFID